MTSIITTATFKKLEDRYPFNEEELGVIVRCHEALQNGERDDFLMSMAKALPYSVFFLPGDELRQRVEWIEDNVLPLGFSGRLRCAITADVFVDYANQGQDKSLERLVEGIADTGRRGTKEALRVIYDILDEDATPESLIELCVCLGFASQALVEPTLEADAVLNRLRDAKPCILSIARSLGESCKYEGISKKSFIRWAEANFPVLSSTLSTFVHNLLFHGHAYPKTKVAYSPPKIYDASGIFEADTSPLLLSLSFTNNAFGGKWHRLYSSDGDGRCFNRLEWALLGYTGPTVTVVKTTGNAVLGAYTGVPWKESKDFDGDSSGFLFRLKPDLCIYRPEGTEGNFAYLHTSSKSTLMPNECEGVPCGLGFGGSLNQPRLFIPESLEGCSAGFLDKTYQMGNLLPDDALEKFEIATIEVWSVNGEEAIKQALRDQADYRERHEMFLMNARVVADKTQFVKDFETGLIPNNLYEHKRSARGRHEFAADEVHGGYKIEKE